MVPVPIRNLALSAALMLVSASAAQAGDRTIRFADLTWDVRSGGGGPGPNSWSDGEESVRVDDQGRLHLKIRKVGNSWQCAEVTAQGSFGYGDYLFQVESDVEAYDPNVVVGLFTYLDDSHEIDIEFARWSVPDAPPAQYTVQPGSRPGNSDAFRPGLKGKPSTHRFLWRERSVLFQSYRGIADGIPPKSALIHEWRCTSRDIPKAGKERVHINFWLADGKPPTDAKEVELIVRGVKVPR
jgi:hypothetical protein